MGGWCISVKQSKKIRNILILTLLLKVCLTSFAFSAELPEIKLNRVPEGYIMNTETLRTVYSAIRTYREERDAWEAAYNDLSVKYTAFAEDVRQEINDIKQSISDERIEWAKAIRKAKMPGLGVFLGGGYTSNGSVEAVAGVGIVWKLLNMLWLFIW